MSTPRKQISGKIAKKQQVNKRIEALAKAIRQKYMTLKLGTVAAAEMSQKLFKPVSEPLEKIVDSMQLEPDPQPTQQTIIVKKELKPSVKRRSSIGMRQQKKKRKLAPVEMIDRSTAMSPMEEIYEHVPEQDEVFDDSIEEIQSMTKTAKAKEEYLAQYSPLAAEYIRLMMETSEKGLFDLIFGPIPNWKTEKWTIGDKPFSFLANNNTLVGDKQYPGTQGLYELLFMSKPNEKVIKEKDRKNYGEILKLSKVYRVNSDPKGKIRSSGSSKYKRFVGPLTKKLLKSVSSIPQASSSSSSSSFRVRADSLPGKISSPRKPLKTSTPDTSSGKGLGDYKVSTNSKIEYVYWNDINELVDRLRLLYASKSAGNTAHDNEIANILEELTEEGIIV